MGPKAEGACHSPRPSHAAVRTRSVSEQSLVVQGIRHRETLGPPRTLDSHYASSPTSGAKENRSRLRFITSLETV
jgi:hypothetical protein